MQLENIHDQTTIEVNEDAYFRRFRSNSNGRVSEDVRDLLEDVNDIPKLVGYTSHTSSMVETPKESKVEEKPLYFRIYQLPSKNNQQTSQAYKDEVSVEDELGLRVTKQESSTRNMFMRESITECSSGESLSDSDIGSANTSEEVPTLETIVNSLKDEKTWSKNSEVTLLRRGAEDLKWQKSLIKEVTAVLNQNFFIPIDILLGLTPVETTSFKNRKA